MGFLGRILAELARLKFSCGSCLFGLLRWGLFGPGVFFVVVSHYDLFERFVYIVYVGDGV